MAHAAVEAAAASNAGTERPGTELMDDTITKLLSNDTTATLVRLGDHVVGWALAPAQLAARTLFAFGAEFSTLRTPSAPPPFRPRHPCDRGSESCCFSDLEKVVVVPELAQILQEHVTARTQVCEAIRSLVADFFSTFKGCFDDY